MARRPRKKPTFKQKIFAQEYVRNKGNATRAALKAYDTEDRVTAASIWYENLRKPHIHQEINRILHKAGITVKHAVRAISDGLDSESGNVQLRAAHMTLKLLDAYPR